MTEKRETWRGRRKTFCQTLRHQIETVNRIKTVKPLEKRPLPGLRTARHKGGVSTVPDGILIVSFLQPTDSLLQNLTKEGISSGVLLNTKGKTLSKIET